MSAPSQSASQLAQSLLDYSINGVTHSPTDSFNHLWHQIETRPTADLTTILNLRDESGRTTLHHGCIRQMSWLVKRLLSLPQLDLNVQDGQGQTSLHLALKMIPSNHSASSSTTGSNSNSNGWIECASLILDEEERRQKSQLLNSSTTESKESSLTELPSSKRTKLSDDSSFVTPSAASPQLPSLLTLRDSFGRLPLHWSLNLPSLMLRCLRPDLVNAQTSSGETPAHWASQDDNIEALEILLSAGADVTLKNARNETIEDVAKSAASKSVIQAWAHKNASLTTTSKSPTDQSSSDTISASSLSRSSASSAGRSTVPKKKVAIKMNLKK